MKRFALTKNHIKLLRNAYVSWWDCETGAPSIDCKRPYGNSFVAGDIHEILTGKKLDYGELDSDLESEYLALHSETSDALQIVLFTGKFQPGVYEAAPYTREWKLVKKL